MLSCVTPEARHRPPHLRPAYLLLVLVGGALGTGAREGISLAFPPVDGIPVAVLVINVVGAFLLGWLLDGLARRGPDGGRRRPVRLLLGTGLLGGFTACSTLATGAARPLGAGRTTAGLTYALLTVVVGAAATFAGIALAAVTHRSREARGG